MAKVLLDDLSAHVRDTVVAVNRACWELRQNQGVEDAAGLDVMLPTEISFEVEVLVAGGANTLSRTETKVTPAVTTTETTTEAATTRNQTDDVGVGSSTRKETPPTMRTNTGRSGNDTRDETYDYKDLG